jgi:cobalt-zinc-cadmium efflux system outer membrane protein
VDLQIKFPDRPPTHPLTEWGVAQNFLNLLMLPLRTRVAREQLVAAQMRVSDDVVKLISEVKVAYHELLADSQTVALLRTILAAQAGSLELTQRLHEAGNVTDLALSQEQAQYSRMRLELAMAEADSRSHREKLNRLLGVWGADTAWKLAATNCRSFRENDVSIEGLETLAIGNRLDLAAARSQLQSAARAVGLEKTFRFIGALDFGIVGEHEPDGANLVGPSFRFELPILIKGRHASPAAKPSSEWPPRSLRRWLSKRAAWSASCGTASPPSAILRSFTGRTWCRFAMRLRN